MNMISTLLITLTILLSFPIGMMLARYTKNEIIAGKKYLRWLQCLLLLIFAYILVMPAPEQLPTSATLLFILGLVQGSIYCASKV